MHHSLRRSKANQVPVKEPLSFSLELSIRVEKGKKDDSVVYLLHSMHHEKSSMITEFCMLQRQIISGKSRWGLNILFYGEFSYIYLYWELTKHVVSCLEQLLRSCLLYQAEYASLYSYSHDVHILRVFCQSWRCTTNTLCTMIFLWDLHRVDGLPINGRIYNENVAEVLG